MNDAYTIYLKADLPDIPGGIRIGEPLYCDRRTLKWIVESYYEAMQDLPHPPDAIIMQIDRDGRWEHDAFRVRVGHVKRDFTDTVVQIQRRLSLEGVAYVEYFNGDTGDVALLKLVRTSEFRYDRYWRHPGDTYYVLDGRNHDDGTLNPDVHCGVFSTEAEALQWLSEQEPND